MGELSTWTLDFLDICTSPLGSVERVFGVVDTIFPRLRNLGRGWIYWGPHGPEVEPEPVGVEDVYYRCWGQIIDTMVKLRGSRDKVMGARLNYS
jgi:hypothetical protein